MRNLISGVQFQRDVKLARKRDKNMAKLHELIMLLSEGASPPQRCKDHPLRGNWQHYRDCHIEADWLLIYKIVGDDVYLVRTGSRSDLF